MKVPVSWMSSYCDPGWEPEHLAERLAMTGTEVERVGIVGAPSAEGFVVGRVLAVEPHPDADRLSVCKLDAGEVERTIVCGAPNVAAGQLVAVALPGAVLPDGTKLKQAKLRGVVSDGMILSETELGIGDDADGIMVLDDPASSSGQPSTSPGSAGLARPGAAGPEPTPGDSLAELLPVSEPVLELAVTTNRPDCLSIYGVAREAHAISEAPLADPPWSEDAEAGGEGSVSDHASVSVEAPELCQRFTVRVFLDVEVGPSPAWLKSRLMAAGQRPINNVVDITNYVMLVTGQPLHAFDLEGVPDGELVVRRASEGEKMTTLDGVERSFDSETMLVCDREGPSSIAGIMGGQTSEVSDSTKRVLLEVATWDGVNILRSSRSLGLRSEASARFEKQLHPELTMRAQQLASRMLIDLCGARMVPGTIDVHEELPEPRKVTLRVARVKALVGMEIDADTCAARLERLGFGLERRGEEELVATVPPERDGDVTREADLIEEVARLADLDRTLPATLPAAGNRVGGLTREQGLRRLAEDVLRDLGGDEIISWSFTEPGLADGLRLPEGDRRRDVIAIANPLSADQSVMRTTLAGGLLDAARYNLSRGAERVALFESGRVYLRDGEPVVGSGPPGGEFSGRRPPPVLEPHRLGLLLSGAPQRAWRDAGPAPDFFVAKGILEALCGQLGAELQVEPAEEPFLHPGKSGRILIGELPAGWIGELHPLVARAWDLDAAAGFELDMGPVVTAAAYGEERYEDFTTYPPVNEDVAVVVPEGLPAAEVRAAVLEAGGALLHEAEIFDLYRGKQVGEGKSLALRLTYRASDRTLTEEEIAERRDAVRVAVEKIGGSLRE
ncbi:MAG: phenylalanine--tRNA ligase subunit beta [Solirubrobacterales bacterium]|nr:phenylalanine--tRNA ligase subunit beta [Solirubrobacterales bacterium]